MIAALFSLLELLIITGSWISLTCLSSSYNSFLALVGILIFIISHVLSLFYIITYLKTYVKLWPIMGYKFDFYIIQLIGSAYACRLTDGIIVESPISGVNLT